jgi:hypothetical protein
MTARGDVWETGPFLVIWLTRNFPIVHNPPSMPNPAHTPSPKSGVILSAVLGWRYATCMTAFALAVAFSYLATNKGCPILSAPFCA